MEGMADVRSIAAIRRQLVDALPVLDEMRYSIAAAHLASAIDVLDNELARAGAPARPTAASFAVAMEGEFGHRAIEVAQTQVEDAAGEVRAVWVEILSHLGD